MKKQHQAVKSVALTTAFPCPANTTLAWQTITRSERLQHFKLNQIRPSMWPRRKKTTIKTRTKSWNSENILLFSRFACLHWDNKTTGAEPHFFCSVCGFWHSWNPFCSPRQQNTDLKMILHSETLLLINPEEYLWFWWWWRCWCRV